MAKNKKDKNDKKSKKERKAGKATKADRKTKPSKAAEVARRAGAAIASHPAVTEIVAATLVGAAAALRNPKKAKALANAAGDDLQALTKEAADKGSALWTLAMDVARKGLETLDLLPPETPVVAPPGRKPVATRKPAVTRKPAARKRTTPKKA